MFSARSLIFSPRCRSSFSFHPTHTCSTQSKVVVVIPLLPFRLLVILLLRTTCFSVLFFVFTTVDATKNVRSFDDGRTAARLCGLFPKLTRKSSISSRLNESTSLLLFFCFAERAPLNARRFSSPPLSSFSLGDLFSSLVFLLSARLSNSSLLDSRRLSCSLNASRANQRRYAVVNVVRTTAR